MEIFLTLGTPVSSALDGITVTTELSDIIDCKIGLPSENTFLFDIIILQQFQTLGIGSKRLRETVNNLRMKWKRMK